MIWSVALLSIIFPFLYKYSFVSSNQYEQIPIILRFVSGNYLSSDWFLTTVTKFGPRYFFSIYMAFLNHFASLSVLFIVHYILTTFLIAYATFKLAEKVTGNRFASFLTSIVILFGSTFSLGGNILVTGDFTNTQLSLGLSLLAIVLLLKERFLFSSLLFIISAYFQLLVGFESFFVFNLAYFIYLIKSTHRKKAIKSFILKSVLPFIILCLPLVFLSLKISAGNIPVSLKIQIPAMMRGRHHYMPTAFPGIDYFLFFLFLAVSIEGLLVFRKKISIKIKQIIFWVAIISFSLIIIGTISLYFYPLYILVVMQPFRLTIYIYWLLMTAFTAVIFYGVRKDKIPGFLIILPVFFPIINNIHSSGKTGLVALFVGGVFCLFYKRSGRILITLLLLFYFSLWQHHAKFNFSTLYQFPDQETQVAEFARQNTPTEAVFLVPPEFEKFRLVASRAIVADWKSFPFAAGDFYEWYKRMCLLGNKSSCPAYKITVADIVAGYESHNGASITSLAKRFGADYIVSPVFYPELSIVFRNRFFLYKIN